MTLLSPVVVPDCPVASDFLKAQNWEQRTVLRVWPRLSCAADALWDDIWLRIRFARCTVHTEGTTASKDASAVALGAKGLGT